MKKIPSLLFLMFISSCSFFAHKLHKEEALSQKNMDAFANYSKGKVESCFNKKKLKNDEFYATHVIVEINSNGSMKPLSYYPDVKEFNYQCLKTVIENFILIDSKDYNTKRRLKIVQY